MKAVLDKIIITDLLTRTLIGINAHERTDRQEVFFTVTLEVFSRAENKDQIDSVVNYKEVADKVVALAESASFFLLETLAEDVSAMILRDFQVKSVLLRLDKPRALPFTRSVAIEINRCL